MVDKTDPGEQYGGAGTEAQIQEALKNVADLLSRVSRMGAQEGDKPTKNTYETQPNRITPGLAMQKPSEANAYRNVPERYVASALRYAGMATEAGLKKAASGVEPYRSEGPAGRGAMNVYASKATTPIGALNKLPGTYPVYPQPGARGTVSPIPNAVYEASNSPLRHERFWLPYGPNGPALPPSYPLFSATATTGQRRKNFIEDYSKIYDPGEIPLRKEYRLPSRQALSTAMNEYKQPPQLDITIDEQWFREAPDRWKEYVKYESTRGADQEFGQDFLTRLAAKESSKNPNAVNASGAKKQAEWDAIFGAAYYPFGQVKDANKIKEAQAKWDAAYKNKKKPPFKRPTATLAPTRRPEAAVGLYQFMESTAEGTEENPIGLVKRNEFGEIIYDGRKDPIEATKAVMKLTRANKKTAKNMFPNETPSPEDLYMFHMLGAGNYRIARRALAKNPNTPAISVFTNDEVVTNNPVKGVKNPTIEQYMNYHMESFGAQPNTFQQGGLVGPGGMRVDPGSDPTTPAAQRKSRSQQPTRAGVLRSLMPTAEESPEDKIRSAIQNAAENVGRFITQSRDSGALGGALSQVAQWPVTAVTNPLLAANQAQQMLDPAYNISKGMAETKLSAEQRDLPGVITGVTQTAGGALGLIPGAGLLPKRPPVYSPAAGQRAMARTATPPTTQAFENPTPFAGVQGELFPNQKLGPITNYDTELDTNFSSFSKQDFENPTPFANAQRELFPNEKLGPVTNKSLIKWLQPYGFENHYLNSSEAEFVGKVSDELRRLAVDSLENQQTIFNSNNPQITRPFKSKLEETILKLNPETTKPLTKAGWEKVLTAVRKQEQNESGLTGFLESKGNEKISLDEIKNYLFEQQNLVNVIETTREPLDSLDLSSATENIYNARHRLGYLKQELYDKEFYENTDISSQVFSALYSALIEKELAVNAYDDAINLLNMNRYFEDYTMSGGSNYRNILLSWYSPSRGNVPASEHFHDIPNNFVHMRLKDRFIDSIKNESGNFIPLDKRLKSLSIEEVQSDIHQRGRQYNYKTYDPSKPVAEQVPQDYEEYLKRPAFDAPFKDNAWLKIAIKRLLVEALDKGYDYISWIPGNTHNGTFIKQREIKPGQRPELFYDKVFREVAESISGGKATVLDPDSFNTFSIPEAKDGIISVPVAVHAIHIRDPKVLAKIKKLKESGMYQYAVPAAVGTGAAATTMGGQDKEFRVGGLVGPGGMRMRPYNEQPSAGEPMRFGYTPPVDRPILPAERPMPQYQEPPMPQRPGAPGLTPPRFDFMERRFPSYQEGGMIGPGGMPVRPAGVTPQQAPTMASDQLESEIQRMMQQNPQAVQQIQQEIMSAMQTGELTPQELNMMVQLATLAAQNPQMYPQIRQFAIQQGIASEEDLGQEYDQGLVFTILLAARASQQQAQGGASPAMGQAPQVPQAAMQPPVASMMSGGALPQKSQNADGSVPIIAHEGEYVIPKEIVLQKGTDFFDKLIGKGPNASGNVR